MNQTSPTKAETHLSDTIGALLAAWSELRLNEGGQLYGDECAFAWRENDPDVQPPASLPSIVHDERLYLVIPAGIDLPEKLTDPEHSFTWSVSPVISDRAVLAEGAAAFPPEDADWPKDEEIVRELKQYQDASSKARQARHYRDILAQANRDLYASTSWIADETPMLVEGLMRERGVSVFYGAFDEFKTTLVLDIVAHVACGADWQGRKVKPRPVIWYALEGAEEARALVRAQEARLRGRDTPWGDAPLPIKVLDRIPDTYMAWRTELHRLARRWEDVVRARDHLDGMPEYQEPYTDKNGQSYEVTSMRYPDEFSWGRPGPLVVIDTLSMALGGDDAKGPRASGFINDCLDLLKKRPDLEVPEEVVENYDEDARAQWIENNPDRDPNDWLDQPVASHIIPIHHQTKTGVEFAGHYAIGANTQALYRVHRFGRMTDPDRPYAGQLTLYRVKGIPRPAPLRFEVEVVPIEGTRQTAAVIKNKAADIPKELRPVIAALRELEDPEQFSRATLNDCLNAVAAKGRKSGPAIRQARKRIREQLEASGVVEPVVNEETDRVEFYRFHGAAI